MEFPLLIIGSEAEPSNFYYSISSLCSVLKCRFSSAVGQDLNLAAGLTHSREAIPLSILEFKEYISRFYHYGPVKLH